MKRYWFNLRYGLLAAPLVFGAAVIWAQDSIQPLATGQPAPPTQVAPLSTKPPPLSTQPAPLTTQPAPLSTQPAPLTTAPTQVQDPDGQKGVEVLTRGPIHEAYASLAGDPEPTKQVAKKPPAPIEEMPPAEKPEGDVAWIKGYWAWDDDRNDFLWVSGVWRAAPPGKEWLPGYWREDGDKAQWVPGFWTAASKDNVKQEVTYLPQPPAPPDVAPPAQPQATPDTFYVPGHWVWNGERYAWQAGYWAKVQPGYVWVAAHYRWTPTGYVHIPGYWDLAVSRRGVLYAPVFITPGTVRVGFVYTPAYAVNDTLVVDTLWVRPTRCHYYFGDYYGPAYRDMGYESCIVYNERHYDCIIVYERWDHRREPDWYDARMRGYHDRYDHPDHRPPHTLVEARIGGVKFEIVATPRRIAEVRGQKMVRVEHEERVAAMKHAEAVHEATVRRVEAEKKMPLGAPVRPRVAVVEVPAHTVAPAHVTETVKPITTPGHTTEAVKPIGVPPGTGLAPTGTHPGDTAKPGTTTTPGHTTTPPAHTPPAKDKDKDKDKDKKDNSH